MCSKVPGAYLGEHSDTQAREQVKKAQQALWLPQFVQAAGLPRELS